jgi:hypothetical protein
MLNIESPIGIKIIFFFIYIELYIYMNSIILFENRKIGKMPYKSYNCSIIKLNKQETFDITNRNEESILITFFVSSPGKRYGTMNWIGIMSYEKILQLLNNIENDSELWFIKPHLLQNDKGPKCADLRIFKMKNNIGVIGYTRVAPKSNTNGIADYYVRASLLDTRINDSLYKNPDKLYHFNEIDGGCFPSKICNNYKKFKIKNDNCKTNNIEFFIKDNETSKLVSPHTSKDKLMPFRLKLNGIEVSFSKTSANEDSKTHVSTKNIVPLQHIDYLDNLGCFVDFSPPNLNDPIITVQDMISGNVLHNDKILINKKFRSKKYRGSTPFIEMENNQWITIVHERNTNKEYIYDTYYDYIVVIFDSKIININNNKIILPNKCIKELPLNINSFEKDFIYITGIIILDKIFDEDLNLLELEILISYGISDTKSGISKVKII